MIFISALGAGMTVATCQALETSREFASVALPLIDNFLMDSISVRARSLLTSPGYTLRHDRVIEERDPEEFDAFLGVPLDGDR